jgi:uncharacterized protein (TIGR00251 family)
MNAWRRVPGGVEVFLRVTPNAGRDAILGVEQRGAASVLRVKVTAIADRGKANAAVIALLSSATKLPRPAFTLTSGDKARDKRLRIEGDVAAIEAALGRLGTTL